MDDRDNSIAKDLEASKSMSGNSDELNAKAQEMISNAKKEAAVIRQKAIDDEKAVAATKVVAKQNMLEKEYEASIQKIAEERHFLRTHLLSQMPLFKESLKAKFSTL